MFIPWPLRPDAGYKYLIVGAGPAGLYLARQLAASGRVLVIDAGNTTDTHNAGGEMYRLGITGRDYHPLGTRLASFGGSSNHWGGKCYPLSPEVFAPRAGFRSWPFLYAELSVQLPAAAAFLNLQPFADPATSSLNSGVLRDYDNLDIVPFENSAPVLRLGEPTHVAAFGTEAGIDILSDTRLIDFDLSPSRSAVTSVTFRHRPSGEATTISVPTLILCAGGIENARILLWAGRKYGATNPLVGGPNQLTGTQFLEKTYFAPVDLFLDARADLRDAGSSEGLRHAFMPTQAFRAAHRLPRFAVFSDHNAPLAEADPGLSAVDRYYVGDSSSWLSVDPHFQFEYTPTAQSYVGLGDALDPDGVASAVLHWAIEPNDFVAFRRAVLLFCGLLNQRGLARARLKPNYQTEDWSGVDLSYCNHHVGTTPMGATPRDGVLDADGRVWGVANLYVAGSSVFPNSDCINPTLTIVALAGRLAEHLKAVGA